MVPRMEWAKASLLENHTDSSPFYANFEDMQREWDEEWHKECIVHTNYAKTRPDYATISFYHPLPKMIPNT